jgi:hypothetical protein
VFQLVEEHGAADLLIIPKDSRDVSPKFILCRTRVALILLFSPSYRRIIQIGYQSEKPHPVCSYICGFNIAILTGILLAASRPIFGHKRSAWFVLGGIALYTILVGADAAVLRTDELGTIKVISDGRAMWWEAR